MNELSDLANPFLFFVLGSFQTMLKEIMILGKLIVFFNLMEILILFTSKEV